MIVRIRGIGGWLFLVFWKVLFTRDLLLCIYSMHCTSSQRIDVYLIEKTVLLDGSSILYIMITAWAQTK
jgi:hypothetical protein